MATSSCILTLSYLLQDACLSGPSQRKACRPSAALQAALVQAECALDTALVRAHTSFLRLQSVNLKQSSLGRQIDSLLAAELPVAATLLRTPCVHPPNEGAQVNLFPAVWHSKSSKSGFQPAGSWSSLFRSSLVPTLIGPAMANSLIEHRKLPATFSQGFTAWRIQDAAPINAGLTLDGLPVCVGDVLLSCATAQQATLNSLVAAFSEQSDCKLHLIAMPGNVHTWFSHNYGSTDVLEVLEAARSTTLNQAELERNARAASAEVEEATRAIAAVRQSLVSKSTSMHHKMTQWLQTSSIADALRRRQTLGAGCTRRFGQTLPLRCTHSRGASIPYPLPSLVSTYAHQLPDPAGAAEGALPPALTKGPSEFVGSQYDRDDRAFEPMMDDVLLQNARAELSKTLQQSPVIRASPQLQQALAFLQPSALSGAPGVPTGSASSAALVAAPMTSTPFMAPQAVRHLSAHVPLPDFVYSSRMDCIASVLGHRKPAYSVVHDQTGACIITGSDDKDVKVWSSATGQLLLSLRGFTTGHVTDLSVNADNTLVAAATDASNGFVRVWHLSSGKEHSVLRCHCAGVNYVAFHPSDPLLLITAADDGTAVASQLRLTDKTAGLFQMQTPSTPVVGSPGSPQRSLPPELPDLSGTESIELPHTSADQSWFCRHGEDCDVSSGIQDAQDFSGKRTHVLTLCVHPLGSCFVTGGDDGQLRVWTLPQGTGRSGPQEHALRTIVAGVQFVRSFQAHNGKVTTLSFSPSGQFLVSGCLDDSAAQLWTYNKSLAHWVAVQLHTATGEQSMDENELDRTGKKKILRAPGIHDAKFTTDEKHVVTSQSWRPPGAVASEESDSEEEAASLYIRIKVWHCFSGQLVASFVGHSREVNVVLPSPVDPSIILTGGTDGRINLWRIPSKANKSDLKQPILPLRTWRLRKCRQLLSDEGLPLQAAVAQEAALGAVQLPMTQHQAEVWSNVHNAVLDASWGVDGLSFAVVDMDGRFSVFGLGALDPALLTDWTRSPQIKSGHIPSVSIDANSSIDVHSGFAASSRKGVRFSTSVAAHLAMQAPFVQFTNRDDEQLVADALGRVVERDSGLRPSQVAGDTRTSNLYSEPYFVLAAPLAAAHEQDGTAQHIPPNGCMIIGIACLPQDVLASETSSMLPRALPAASTLSASIWAVAASSATKGTRPQSESALLSRQRARLQRDTSGCKLDSVAAGIHLHVSLKAVADALAKAQAMPVHEALGIPELQFVQRASGEATAVRISNADSNAAPSARRGVKASAGASQYQGQSAPTDNAQPEAALYTRFNCLKPRPWSALYRRLGASTCWEQSPEEVSQLALSQQRLSEGKHTQVQKMTAMQVTSQSSVRIGRSRGSLARARPSRHRAAPAPQYISDSDDSAADDDARTLQAAQAGISRFQRSVMRHNVASQQASASSARRASRHPPTAALVESDSSSEGEQVLELPEQQLVSRVGAVADFALFDDATQGKSIDRDAASAAAQVREAYKGRSEWLMRTRPTPGAYVPQLGDRVVYCPAAHAEAMGVKYEASVASAGMHSASGRPKRHRSAAPDPEAKSDGGDTLFPWQRWPSYWGMVQCELVHLEFVPHWCEFGHVTLAECTLQVQAQPQVLLGAESTAIPPDAATWNAPVSMQWDKVAVDELGAGLLQFKVRYSAVGAAPWVAVLVGTEWRGTEDSDVPQALQCQSTEKANYAVGGDFLVLQSRVDVAMNCASSWLSGLAATGSLTTNEKVAVAEHLDNRLAVTTAWLSDLLSDYTEPDRYSSFGGSDAVMFCAPGRHGSGMGMAPQEPPASETNQHAHVVFLTFKSAIQVCDGFVLTCPDLQPAILDLNYRPVQDVNTPPTEVHNFCESSFTHPMLWHPPIPIARGKFSGTASDTWRSAEMFVSHLRDKLQVQLPSTLAEMFQLAETIHSPVAPLLSAASGAGEAADSAAQSTASAEQLSASQRAALRHGTTQQSQQALRLNQLGMIPVDPLAKKSGLLLHMGSMCKVLAAYELTDEIAVQQWPQSTAIGQAANPDGPAEPQVLGGTKRSRDSSLGSDWQAGHSRCTLEVVAAFRAILRRPYKSLQVMFGPESGISGALTDAPTSEELSPWDVMPLWAAPTVQHVVAASGSPPTEPESFEEPGRYQGFLSSKRSRSQFDTAWDTRFDRAPGLSVQQQGRVLFCAKQLALHPNGEDFLYDPDVRLIPGYAQAVLVPMSLQRIAQRVLRAYYRSTAGLIHDCILLVSNCDVFNQAGSEITQAARGVAAALLLAAGVDPSDIPAVGSTGLRALQEFGLTENTSNDTESEFEEEASAEETSQHQMPSSGEGILTYQGVQLQALPQRGGRRQEFVGTLSRIVGNASQLDPDGYFDEPVDESVYIDYRDSVSDPICLTDVRKRLKQYDSVQQAAADLLRIYDNAMAYNPAGHPVHQLALQIKLDLVSELGTAQLQLRTPIRSDLPFVPEAAQLAQELGLSYSQQSRLQHAPAAVSVNVGVPSSPRSVDSEEYYAAEGAAGNSDHSEGGDSSEDWGVVRGASSRGQRLGGRRRARNGSSADTSHSGRLPTSRRQTRARVSYGE